MMFSLIRSRPTWRNTRMERSLLRTCGTPYRRLARTGRLYHWYLAVIFLKTNKQTNKNKKQKTTTTKQTNKKTKRPCGRLLSFQSPQSLSSCYTGPQCAIFNHMILDSFHGAIHIAWWYGNQLNHPCASADAYLGNRPSGGSGDHKQLGMLSSNFDWNFNDFECF